MNRKLDKWENGEVEREFDTLHATPGSLSNHDDNGNKNPTNLHIWQWQTVFLHALHVNFSSFDISKTWNNLFCSCVDDVSIWWQMFNFALCLKRWFQFNSRIVRTHFSSIMTLNNWKMIAEKKSYIFRWRSPFRLPPICLSSLLSWFSKDNAMANRTCLSFLPMHFSTHALWAPQIVRKMWPANLQTGALHY